MLILIICCLYFDLHLFLTPHLIYTLLITPSKRHLPNHWLQQEEEPLVTPKHDPQEAIVASGEISGASGTSEPSGDASSADTEISGTSGVPDVSASGDTDDTVTVIVKTKEGQS